MLKLAFCGNGCNTCERYTATQSGNTERLKEAAVLWKKLGYRDDVEPPEKIVCYGCSSASWCRFGIKECTLENKVSNCGRCSKYPCETTAAMLRWNLMHAEHMKDKCSKEEYERLLNLPDIKKQNLDNEHRTSA